VDKQQLLYQRVSPVANLRPLTDKVKRIKVIERRLSPFVSGNRVLAVEGLATQGFSNFNFDHIARRLGWRLS
jgi:hypothetical protein